MTTNASPPVPDDGPARSGLSSAFTEQHHDRRTALRFLGATVGVAGFATVGLTGCEPPVPADGQPAAKPLDHPNGDLGSWVGQPAFTIGKGGYCWFQGPRAAFTPGSSTLWVGSTASNQGASINGNVLVRQVDVSNRRVVAENLIGKGAEDDHSSASVLPFADGTVLTGWTSRRRDPWLEVGKLGQPLERINRPNASVSRGGQGCSYTATYEIGNEIWLLYRGEQWLWNLMRSPDGGKTWTYAGIVAAPSKPVPRRVGDKLIAPSRTGHRPYLQAVAHQDELHLLVTEAHPTSLIGCSVYSMIVKSDLTVTDSMGQTIGHVGNAPPLPSSGTLVLAGATGGSEGRAWLCDLAVSGGAPTAVLSTRNDQTHQYWTARRSPDGQWQSEHLCSGGGALYPDEPDYCGLGTVDRSSPGRVVVSTTVDPLTGLDLVSAVDGRLHWELWEGTSTGPDVWEWTAITANSTVDQIRPLAASSTTGDKALVWMSGTYRSYRDYDTQIMVATTN